MATTTLALYWNLSSVHKKERLESSVKLVSALEQFQDQFTVGLPKSTGNGDASNEGSTVDVHLKDLDSNNAADVSYAIKRLIRGLASPRDSSRQGFAVALTELLAKIDTISCQQILSILVNNSQVSGSMTGQEERDNLFARLFGIKAIIQSGLLVKQTPLRTSSAAPTSLQCFDSVLSELLALGEKKTWLRESCWWTILSALDAITSSNVPWKDEASKLILNKIYKEDKTWTSEKIALTLRMKESYPNIEWDFFITPPFKGSDILATPNLLSLGRVLKDSYIDEGDEATTSRNLSGAWKPQLHFAWGVIIELLLKSNEKITETKFQDFYRIVVDENLFAASSSPERKYWGFQVFQTAIHRLNQSELPVLFTPNFMRTWINHLSKNDRYLHKIAKQVALDVQGVVVNDPNAGLALILRLTGMNGSKQFDRITKTKTVESILSSMSSQGISTYTEHLIKQFNENDLQDNDTASVDSRRVWVIDQLVAILRNGSVPKDDDCIVSVLNWLTMQSFFEVTKKSGKSLNGSMRTANNPPLTDALRKTCRTKVLFCLADLTDRIITVDSDKDGKKTKLTGTAVDGEYWVSKVFKVYVELLMDKHVKLVAPLDEESKKLLPDASKVISDVLGNKHRSNPLAECYKLLIAGIAIKCLVDDNSEEDGTQKWELLQTCIEGAKGSLHKPPKKLKASVDDKDLPAVDMLVDNIIALLEYSSAYTRSLANQTFAMITSEVQESTIDLILAQLEDHEHNDDMDEDDTAADENSEHGTEGNSDEADSEDGSKNDNNDEDEEGDEEEAAALRQKLEAVFGDSEIGVESGEDGSDDDEVSMDDEQMMQIDEKLAAVFKNRMEDRKKGRNGAQREATYFKNRVLDLVDSYMKRETTNVLLLRLIVPLVDLILHTSPDERQLADKTNGILRSHMQRHKEKPAITDANAAIEVLKTLHEKARRVHNPELLSTISLCSLYVSRGLLGKDEQAVARVYRGSIIDFATRKSSPIQPGFIADFIRRMPNVAWEDRDSLVSSSENAVNGFRQCQVFYFAQALLSTLTYSESRGKEIQAFTSDLSREILNAIQKSCKADKPFISSTQMKDLLKNVLQIARTTMRILPDDTPAIWNSKAWSDLAETLTTGHYKNSSSLSNTCKQVSQIVDGKQSKDRSNKRSTKRKVDNDIDGQENSGQSHSKRKKSRKQLANESS